MFQYGRTPLHGAAEEGHESTVVLLLDRGADQKAKDKVRDERGGGGVGANDTLLTRFPLCSSSDCSPPQDGKTPYDFAKKKGHTKIMELVASNTQQLREVEEYKVRDAAKNGNDDDVRSLLDNQVNVNAADDVSTSARVSRRVV